MTDDDKALVERLWNRVEYRWDGQTQIREIDTDATYAAHRIEELSAENERLRQALQWYVDNDDTNEGDESLEEHGGRSWNELNEYWIEGRNRARAALGETK